MASTLWMEASDGRARLAWFDRSGEGGRSVPPALRATPGGGGAHGPDGHTASRPVGRGDGPVQGDLQADQAGWRRPAQGHLVAGADAPQSALCRRHQGSGRLPPVLRAAGCLGPRGQPAPQARRRDPQPRGRHPCRRRQVGGLEDQAGRALARRPAAHGRRCRLHLGLCQRPRHGDGFQRLLQGRHGREDRRLLGGREVQAAHAVLGRYLRRLGRRHSSPASVRRLHRRQVARGADQPQARRHRSLQVQGLQAGRSRHRRDQHGLPRAQPAALRRHRDEGWRRCRVGRARRAADR